LWATKWGKYKTHAVCCIGKFANFRHLPKNFSAPSVNECKVLIVWGEIPGRGTGLLSFFVEYLEFFYGPHSSCPVGNGSGFIWTKKPEHVDCHSPSSIIEVKST
jgi:hypothetical protein